MNLADFRANGGFSQRMLEHFRESQWSDSDNTGTAMLFEEHLLEQMLRVQQPPKMRKNSALA